MDRGTAKAPCAAVRQATSGTGRGRPERGARCGSGTSPRAGRSRRMPQRSRSAPLQMPAPSRRAMIAPTRYATVEIRPMCGSCQPSQDANMVTSVTEYVASTQGSRRAGRRSLPSPAPGARCGRGAAPTGAAIISGAEGSAARATSATMAAGSRSYRFIPFALSTARSTAIGTGGVGRRRRLPAALRSIVRSGPAPSSAALLRSPPGKVGPQSAAETAESQTTAATGMSATIPPSRKYSAGPSLTIQHRLESSGAAQTPSEAMRGVSTARRASCHQDTSPPTRAETARRPATLQRRLAQQPRDRTCPEAPERFSAAQPPHQRHATPPPRRRATDADEHQDAIVHRRDRAGAEGPHSALSNRTQRLLPPQAPIPARPSPRPPGRRAHERQLSCAAPPAAPPTIAPACRDVLPSTSPARHHAAKVATSTACSPTMSSGHLIIPPSLRHNFQFPLRCILAA